MEDIRGWAVVAFTKERKQLWAQIDVKGLASGGRPISTIPIVLNKDDANLIAAHVFENNTNVEDIALVYIGSMINGNKPVMQLIHDRVVNPTKKWYQFWR